MTENTHTIDETTNCEMIDQMAQMLDAATDLDVDQESLVPEDFEFQNLFSWQERTGLNEDSLCGAIETIVFMSDKPIAINKIKNLIDEEMPLRVVHDAIVRLQSEYESKHHGIRLLEVAEGYQFRTKPTFSKYVQDLLKVNSLVLTPTALEVLAIIAYKQPVAKSEIDKIRGVDSSHIVRGLMDKRLVKVAGRSEELGKSVLYGTTPEFLEVFNLADVSQLPPEYELESMVENKVGSISEIRDICKNTDYAKFDFDELDELDELSSNIKSIAADTTFTKSLKSNEQKRIQASTAETETETPEGEEVEVAPAKTAFDLLEEFILEENLCQQNNDAILSEPITMGDDPIVISDLTAGPFNLPEVEDDFDMIDLDTGEALTSLQQVEGPEDTIEELFADDSSLDVALDEAFDRITSINFLENMEEEDQKDQEEVEENLEEKANDLDELTSQMIEEGEDLDIDLGFLNEGPPEIDPDLLPPIQ